MSDIYEPPQRPERPEEAQLHAWWTTQRTQSVDNLEAAARQIITLGSALLTALLGIMALSGETLPDYMRWSGIRWLSALAVIGLFAALSCALVVIYPFPQTVVRNDPAGNADAFEALLRRKNRWLRLAAIAFAVGMAGLLLVIVISLTLIV
ncbi:MAG: hypothetical protein M9941_02260 [Anaerolineae bacterium]|nr:hypothetical protein [Anaerolineae bacterium]MCO5194054.1 hypothetical protein [Anaerolineae bacterium]MCO5196582.1 hypothetical protein [Anaerolineae bacterium]